MKITNLSIHEDRRSNCLSIMTTTTIEDYLNLIDEAFGNKNKGNLEFQRDSLKTKSAIQIRRRMIDDIGLGAVLPPMVVGLIVEGEKFESLRKINEVDFKVFIENVTKDNISLIDGMQRTTALIEAVKNKDIYQQEIRVEFWIASKVNSLIYRMLILNSGQIPWNLRRQIEVIYRSLIKEIQEKVSDLELLKVDDKGRRSKAGQFQANEIIELFLVFGARKETIDTKERVADEFARLDIIEATESNDLTAKFITILSDLSKIDKELSRFNTNGDQVGKFEYGKDLFSSQPAKVGFLTAIAKKIYGRPGTDINFAKQESNYSDIKIGLESLVTKLTLMEDNGLDTFLSYSTLNERISKQSSKVGLFEREFFTKAFEVLIEEHFDITSLHTCWLAY